MNLKLQLGASSLVVKVSKFLGLRAQQSQSPVSKPGPSAPARFSSPSSGSGPPRRFPIGVFLVRFSIGLPLHCPHPCLLSLFLSIHLFKAVRRPKRPSPAGVTVPVWRPSGHTGGKLKGRYGAHDAASCFLGVRIGYLYLPSTHSESAGRLCCHHGRSLYHYFQ